jgi:FAD/FMN-containing dehydrogenase
MSTTPDREAFVAFLRRTLGENGVLSAREDFERYSVDWAGERLGEPLAVARPANTEEVAAVVAYCHEHRIPMAPQGGHSGLVGGALPDGARPELVISLERMNRVRDIDPMNASIAVDGGCVLQRIKDAAADNGCFFALSLGAQGSCQIGGNIATNAGGLNVLRYGMMRELVLGLEVVLPDGRIWRRMQSLHKDNRGYDLAQLFIGSEGTLGIVTGAVLKLVPHPEQRQTALLAVPSVAAAMQLYDRARRHCSGLLSAFELIPRAGIELAFEAAPDLADPLATPATWYVLLEATSTGPLDLAGLVEALLEDMMGEGLIDDGTLAMSEAQAHGLWQLRERMLEGQQQRGLHLRTDVSVPISALADFCAIATGKIAEQAPTAEVVAYGHVGDGNLHFNILPPPAMADEDKRALLEQLENILFEVVAAFDGNISAEHGIGRFKRAAYLQNADPVELALAEALKNQLDPRGLMNPGRILPADA